ncbi:YihY/virulence factor BrkB family protein [Microbacterium sp. NPDC077184]|uniref:YihY/virulence factor BrkB family protein n=1 Tax=Microbacterium sp. NPDC077184 TaxID=3154764 RepID=UPI003415CC95
MSSGPRRVGGSREVAAEAAEAAAHEQTLRARWEATQEQLRERLDEPISRATEITQRTLAWFPVRVWRHFLQHNGFLLAAGVSYQALFATFAGIYVAFAILGLWLGGNQDVVNAMISAINSYIPGLISDEGLFTPDQVTAIATGSTSLLSITGAIAFGTLLWTAIGFVTFTRRAVRDIFGLRPDLRSYVMLKSRDLFGAVLFAVALILGFAATSFGTWALQLIFSLFGWTEATGWYEVAVRLGSIAISFLVFSAALAALIRFLTGTSLRWRRIIPGSLLGGGAITVLQLFTGWLFLYTPSNPLLATFAIFVGLLLWFRIIGIIILTAAAWIAVAASDDDVPLIELSEEERLALEHRALLTAAHVRLRTAEEAHAGAPWYRRPVTARHLRAARAELAEVEASTPAAPVMRGHAAHVAHVHSLSAEHES